MVEMAASSSRWRAAEFLAASPDFVSATDFSVVFGGIKFSGNFSPVIADEHGQVNLTFFAGAAGPRPPRPRQRPYHFFLSPLWNPSVAVAGEPLRSDG